MTSRTYRQVTKKLHSLGFKSSLFELVSEGQWAPADAEWNYYDVPHLNEIHSQANAATLFTLPRHSSSILQQKVSLVSLPAVVTIFESSHNSISYASTVGPYIIFVESSWAMTDRETTRVTTAYSIFSTGIWHRMAWVIRKLLERNYKILMSEDLPMRERRGQLRHMGYGFETDRTGSTFTGSIDLRRNNLKSPCLEKDTWTFSVSELKVGRSTFVGPEDIRGIRLERLADSIIFYPRMCSHEGALLDKACVTENGVKCPWHGRVERTLGSIDLSVLSTNFSLGSHHQVTRDGDQLTIEFIGTAASEI